ncbi:hypothetical protein Q8A73_007076 [Channa argus]|nr:hypothetical protein Q8A73_007076 [Channa argus]
MNRCKTRRVIYHHPNLRPTAPAPFLSNIGIGTILRSGDGRTERAVAAAAAAAAAAGATPGNVGWPSVLTSASSDLRQQPNGVEYNTIAKHCHRRSSLALRVSSLRVDPLRNDTCHSNTHTLGMGTDTLLNSAPAQHNRPPPSSSSSSSSSSSPPPAVLLPCSAAP